MTAISSPLSYLNRVDEPRLIGAAPLLRVQGLCKRYGRIQAVQDVSLDVYSGEIVGIVGESGSGKSSVLRLLNLEELPDEGRYTLALPTAIGLDGVNLFSLDRFTRREVQTQHIGIVYQNPHLGLRMGHTSSGNVAERLLISGERSFHALRAAAREALAASDFPLDRMDDPPRKLSGGMQQRVQLAKAIALRPRLLLLDEPTTGLDVSVQALVLDTLKRLQRERRLAIIIVSHDLGVIRALADRVLVMRQGRVIEQGLTDQVLDDPQDAYTQQLVHAKL
ncbi:MAG: ATP-binding cassette domain-containing protein [Anaerolineae bacterium]|nr:ATP-binding cassette domain-containing protein [Anaerolineae bacterium]MDW8172761.1 ATP-binding cassette domain-containing protein [Anaerolineae bacterium]